MNDRQINNLINCKSHIEEQLPNANIGESEFQRLFLMTRFEREARLEGYRLIAGIDEAGRGALAGPVVSAAAILPDDYYPAGLNDSKLMTQKARDRMYAKLTAEVIAWAVGLRENTEIDEINILRATKLSMELAVNNLLPIRPDYLLIDAVTLTADGLPPKKAIIKGDAQSLSIAAASVIAKVTRDRLMTEYDAVYPQYGFAKHKGYGTAAHMQAIREFGLCPIHRITFRSDRNT